MGSTNLLFIFPFSLTLLKISSIILGKKIVASDEEGKLTRVVNLSFSWSHLYLDQLVIDTVEFQIFILLFNLTCGRLMMMNMYILQFYLLQTALIITKFLKEYLVVHRTPRISIKAIKQHIFPVRYLKKNKIKNCVYLLYYMCRQN